MPPKKKGKKAAAANPARGFATTSSASKPREGPTADLDPTSTDHTAPSQKERSPTKLPGKSSTAAAPHAAPAALPDTSDGPAQPTKTPEELEAQLEADARALFVEAHAARALQDARRHATRLRTERRLLRGQAERLRLDDWFSEELLDRATQLTDGDPSAPARGDPGGELADETVVRNWTLWRTLQELGFQAEWADEAVRAFWRSGAAAEEKETRAGKEGRSGLEWCLEWIAGRYGSELPGYDAREAGKEERAATGTLDPDSAVPGTTLHRSSFHGVVPWTDVRGCVGRSSISGVATPETVTSDDASANAPTPPEELDPFVKAVLYDEVEAHELPDHYVRLKTLLFERKPELTEVSAPSKKKSKPPAPRPDQYGLNVSRLLQSIARVEADPLFDIDLGRNRWAEVRMRLAKEASERRREQHLEARRQAAEADDKQSEDSLPPIPEPEDGPGLDLGDFFSSLPEETAQDANGLSQMAVTAADGTSVIVRSFGTWLGVHPRRVLEDCCKARDPGFRLTFTSLHASSFSNRHSLMLTWSRAQDLPEPNAIPGMECRAGRREVALLMKEISAPDAKQSEALIATAALFYVFGPSPKEEKAHLRLPIVFREYWAELAAARDARKSLEDQEEVKHVRELLDVNGDESHRNRMRADSVETTKPPPKVEGQDAPAILSSPEPASPESLAALWASKSAKPSYRRMLAVRNNLPIASFKREILASLSQNQITIICGETGCGKSTQVPSFILEHCLSNGQDCKIYCTEPRRISAVSLARRVGEELGEAKDELGTARSLVGFAIRLESRTAAATRLVYATTGIVMRMLERGSALPDVTHLVLDEVHERNIDSDFLLIVLRRLLVKRPQLKVVLMSATVNAEQFSAYLGNAPVLNVPGRTFPVETKFLEDAIELTSYRFGSKAAKTAVELEPGEEQDEEKEKTTASSDLQRYSVKTRKVLAEFDEYRIDYDLICQLLDFVATNQAYVDYSKAILVFLPGLAEIRRLFDLVSTHPTFRRDWLVFPLHSTIATEEQERAFQTSPPGVRKIVLATNIAETGITIPDVTCVIDSGKHKEMRFDEKRQLSRLLESFIAQANAKQRRGRAGRVQNGLCFHLFTQARFTSVMAAQQTPEMLRLSLQDLALRVKLCKLGGIEEILGEALDPPLPRNVRRAIDSLVDVKALTPAEELTPLGRQLAKLPLDVYLGKLILLASLFRCLDAGLTIAALLSTKSPFVVPDGARAQADAARLGFRKGDSDLLTLYNAYCAWRRVCREQHFSAEGAFCRKNFLSAATLSNVEELKAQLALALHDAGFLPLTAAARAATTRVRSSFRQRSFVEVPAAYDAHSANARIANAVVAWSFYPKLLRAEGRAWRHVATNQTVALFPASVNRAPRPPATGPAPQWLAFYSIVQAGSRAYHAHDTGAVADLAVALLCGDADFRPFAGVLVIDGNRVRFALPDWRGWRVLKGLRKALREIVAQGIRSPGRPLTDVQEKWLDLWQELFAPLPEKA